MTQDPFSENQDQLNFELELTDNAKAFLRETARWAKFLSIVGFVFLGLFVLLALSISSILSNIPYPGMMELRMMSGTLTVTYLLIAALYFFPTYYLFRFATKTIKAIDNYDSGLLTDGLENLKSTFKFMGILMAIVIGLYALLIVLGIIGALFAM